MTKSLIERLRALATDISNGPASAHWMIATIEEALAALAPVEDATIAAAIDFYRTGEGQNRITADLIERLARDLRRIDHDCSIAETWNAELQQRIEELEARVVEYEERIRGMK